MFLIYEPLAEDRSAKLPNHFTLQGLAFQLKPAGFAAESAHFRARALQPVARGVATQ
jgi:hypothetical protein